MTEYGKSIFEEAAKNFLKKKKQIDIMREFLERHYYFLPSEEREKMLMDRENAKLCGFDVEDEEQ